jgi:hypothetical protein
MNFTLIISLFLLGCASTSRYELPRIWSENFKISYYHGGGMLYESTTVTLSKDSCTYVEMKGGKDNVKKFMLSEEEFRQVLEKMNELEVVKIHNKKQELVHDKASTRLCFSEKGKEDFCIESGATMNIKESDYQAFSEACNYLLNLAKNK